MVKEENKTGNIIMVKAPLSEKIKKNIELKKKWVNEVQSGEIELSHNADRKRVL